MQSTVLVPEEEHLATTEGAIRNNFMVDVLKRNGECFKGTMKRTDAFLSIFFGALRFDMEEFDGAILGYNGNPTVMFKAKNKFNIDNFQLHKECKDGGRRGGDTHVPVLHLRS